MDNTTAVAYVNNLGGTISPQLTELAKSQCMWALERQIRITAQHIPGMLNSAADVESRVMQDWSDWTLNHQIFLQIQKLFGPLEVNLFTSQLSHQLPHYFSWKSDPTAEAIDAFKQNWNNLKGFANPPWCLVGRVLSSTESAGQFNTSGISVERLTMVPSTVINTERLSSSDT